MLSAARSATARTVALTPVLWWSVAALPRRPQGTAGDRADWRRLGGDRPSPGFAPNDCPSAGPVSTRSTSASGSSDRRAARTQQAVISVPPTSPPTGRSPRETSGSVALRRRTGTHGHPPGTLHRQAVVTHRQNLSLQTEFRLPTSFAAPGSSRQCRLPEPSCRSDMTPGRRGSARRSRRCRRRDGAVHGIRRKTGESTDSCRIDMERSRIGIGLPSMRPPYSILRSAAGRNTYGFRAPADRAAFSADQARQRERNNSP